MVQKEKTERVARMKAQSADYILARYNWDIVVDQMLRIYRGERVDYQTVLREHGETGGA